MKGFRDLYPNEKREQNFIFSKWSSMARKYGFEEIAGPLLEEVDLYKKSGSELPEQIYSFVDKNGRKVGIRPELTPSVIRMFKAKSLVRPVKWFSIQDFYRYERPQSGRLREFSQLNLDILGINNVKADAELILTVVEIMKSFGLSKKDFSIKLSNRKLFDDLLNSIGIKKLKNIAKIIDKKEKISAKDFELSLKELKLSGKQIKDLVKILNLKDVSKIKIESKGLEELNELMGYLKSYGILDFVTFDLSVVRGFDYYTSTVFEVFDKSGDFRAIAGGGRYVLDGVDAVGFGMGDVVLGLFLKEKKKLELEDLKFDYYVAPVNEKDYSKAIKIVEKLRSKGSLVEIDLSGRNLGKQFNYANSKNFSKVVIVGSKDKGKVTVRDMKTGKEKKVSI